MSLSKRTLVFGSLMLLPALSFAHSSAMVTSAAKSSQKTIQIYNNSKETIYPIAEIARSQTGVSHPYDYRVYIGANLSTKKDDGLAPGHSATFTLPGTNWYKGGRVYIFDHQPALPSASTLMPGTKIYEDKTGAGFQDDKHYQLVEYTFTSTLADYDISYVDHIYLPLAVEVTNGSVGYNGTGMGIPTFQKQVVNFTTALPYWPKYRLTTVNPNIKIPGGYKLFAQDQSPSSNFKGKLMLEGKREPSTDNKPGETVILHSMLVKWQKWVNDSGYCQEILSSQVANNGRDLAFCQAFQKNVQTVWAAFKQNAAEQGITTTPKAILEHIIGYVHFGSSWGKINAKGSLIGKDAIALESGVPYSQIGAYDKYKYPAYTSPYNLNPYVAFVHRVLNLSAYAFSIDDAIGNVNIPGNGFVIAVGSLKGIPNKTPYVPASSYKFHLNSGPGWTDINVCGTDHKIPANLGHGTSFPITKDKQCKVVLQQNGKTTLSFVATKQSSKTGSKTPCAGNQCNLINIDYNEHDGSLNVDVPAASNTPPPPPSGKGLSVYVGGGTLTYNGDGDKPAKAHSHVTIGVKSGQSFTLTAHLGSKIAVCTVTINGKTITPSDNCSNKQGQYYGAFGVPGTKDANGFIIQSP